MLKMLGVIISMYLVSTVACLFCYFTLAHIHMPKYLVKLIKYTYLFITLYVIVISVYYLLYNLTNLLI